MDLSRRPRVFPFFSNLPFLFFAVLFSTSSPSAAATLTVCASGCAYSDFQEAINAAQSGDTILLRAGETFVGNFWLPAKGGGASILIRSDAPDSVLPPAGTRLVPNGYSGGNTDLSSLARLRGTGGIWKTTPVLQFAPGAHDYRFQFLDIDGVAQEGWSTLLEVGTNEPEQGSVEQAPQRITFDRVYIHGHPVKGQRRCVALNGASVEVLNSYISGCTSFVADAQAIAGFNGPGPYRIDNNYLEASGENILFGGADPKIVGLVPSDITITRNYIGKPLGWRDGMLPAPGGVSAAPLGFGGSLGAGPYYVKVVAGLEIATDYAFSAPSEERPVSLDSNGGAIGLQWQPVPGAEFYRVYIGNSPGAENRHMQTSGNVTSLTYTGGAETWEPPPAAGTRWAVVNLLELKNAQRVLIDGNVFEHVWQAAQKGYAIVLTPRNQEGTAPWSAVRDVTISNNVFRHVGAGINVLGEDDIQPSQHTERITIRNNLAYDVSYQWSESPHFLLITSSPSDIVVDHNTIMHEGMIVLADNGASYGFRFTNNVAPHNTYGIFGSGAGSGTQALSAYFPDGVVRRNAFGGGPAAQYPADNFFPDMGTFLAQFVDAGGADFRLAGGSAFRGAATDGTDLGVDFNTLNAAANADSGGSPPPPPPAPPPPTTGGGGSGSSSPFGGAAAPIPGVIQAEAFDAGVEGGAFHDDSFGNSGGQYRDTDVDVADAGDDGGGYCVGWTAAGEWLAYSVNVGAGGTYTLEVRVASQGAGGTFHVEADGHDVTGPISVPDTGGWQAWTTVRRQVNLGGGAQRWRLMMDGNGSAGAVGNFNWIRVSAGTGGGAGTAFGGTPASLPGILEVENFDEGGEGVAYQDADGGNAGGAYRSGGVDIAADGGASNGYAVGWAFAGEWLGYTVNVAAPGTYALEFRVASHGRGGTFHLEVNGENVTGPLAVPDTGGWDSWGIVRASVTLNGGQQVWHLAMDSNGDTSAVGNFDAIGLGSGSGGAAPFGGAPLPVPGVIQAEDFDHGGDGVAYHDASASNDGGAYRSGGVDIAAVADGYCVGWAFAGEWFTYTVNVTAAGTYDLVSRVASSGTGGTFHIEVNGHDVTGPIAVPDTGGWDSWTEVVAPGVRLDAGQQTWRVVLDANGPSSAVANFDWFAVR